MSSCLRRPRRKMSAVTFEGALPAIKDAFFCEDFATFFDQYRTLPDKQRLQLWNAREAVLSKARLAWDNLRADSARRCASAEQQRQINKLSRFYWEAMVGPALGASWKRRRVALLFKCYRRLAKLSQPIDGLPPVVFDSSRFLKPILEAMTLDKKQSFFEDLDIARKFRPSRVNRFLAEYSLLMLGQQPALTFSELHKILHWVGRDDLRKKIKGLHKRYGELVVPLKPGKPGRPRKNEG
jgi:hypothetical protein